jgi:glycerol-3-phosphate dehydrogenase
LLTVLGGKITTYRRLAEAVIHRLAPYLPALDQQRWTASAALPGGNFPVDGLDDLAVRLVDRYPFLTTAEARRVAAAYGTIAPDWLGQARVRSDLGQDFGGGLSAAEVDHCMDREWACTVEDLLWRRTKLGLRISATGRAAVRDYMAARCAPTIAKGALA